MSGRYRNINMVMVSFSKFIDGQRGTQLLLAVVNYFENSYLVSFSKFIDGQRGTQLLLAVVNYFENSYLGQVTPEGPRSRTYPKFPVQFWNHHFTYGGP